jgi:hypothetical protein
LEHLKREYPNQRGISETRKILAEWSKMGDGKCNILQYTGTDEHYKKYILQRSFGSMKKTFAKNWYVR